MHFKKSYPHFTCNVVINCMVFETRLDFNLKVTTSYLCDLEQVVQSFLQTGYGDGNLQDMFIVRMK